MFGEVSTPPSIEPEYPDPEPGKSSEVCPTKSQEAMPPPTAPASKTMPSPSPSSTTFSRSKTTPSLSSTNSHKRRMSSSSPGVSRKKQKTSSTDSSPLLSSSTRTSRAQTFPPSLTRRASDNPQPIASLSSHKSLRLSYPESSHDDGRIPTVTVRQSHHQHQQSISIVVYVNPDHQTRIPYTVFEGNYDESAMTLDVRVNVDENNEFELMDIVKNIHRHIELRRFALFRYPQSLQEEEEVEEEVEEELEPEQEAVANLQENTDHVSNYDDYRDCVQLFEATGAFTASGIPFPDGDPKLPEKKKKLLGKKVRDVGKLLSPETTRRFQVTTPAHDCYILFAIYNPGMDQPVKVPDLQRQEEAQEVVERLYEDLRSTLGLVMESGPGISNLTAPDAFEFHRGTDGKYYISQSEGLSTPVKSESESVDVNLNPSKSRSRSRSSSTSSIDIGSSYKNQVATQPSRSSQPRNHAILQDSRERILNGRRNPGSEESSYGSDIALYSPIFARFRMLYKQNQEQVDKELNPVVDNRRKPAQRPVMNDEEWRRRKVLHDLVQELMKLRPGDERTRKEKIWGLLEFLLGVEVDSDGLVEVYLRTRSQPDLVVLDVQTSTCTVVFELKAENAALEDVHIQVQMSYLATQRAFWQRIENTKTCGPAFLISLAGQNLRISGAVLPSRMICAPLYTQTLALTTEDDVATVARLNAMFKALKECIIYATHMYRNLPDSGILPCYYDANSPAHDRFFPWPCSFLLMISGVLYRVPFKYLYPLQRQEPYSVFAVTVHNDHDTVPTETNDPHPSWDSEYRGIPYADKEVRKKAGLSGKKLVVKFSRYYGEECHTFAAAHGFAPKLYSWCRFELADGAFEAGLGMAVMDFVDGIHLQPKHYTHYSLKAEVEAVVTQLHENGYVHGDLRSQNILVAGVEKPKIQLVDFTTAVNYPPNSDEYYRHMPSWSDKALQAGKVKDGVINKAGDLLTLELVFGS